MVKLRLVMDAYKQLKRDDLGTAITLCALRRMVKSGDIPTIQIGRKSLINYDLLLQYLCTGYCHSVLEKNEEQGEIRKISRWGRHGLNVCNIGGTSWQP